MVYSYDVSFLVVVSKQRRLKWTRKVPIGCSLLRLVRLREMARGYQWREAEKLILLTISIFTVIAVYLDLVLKN